jgi:uncharacterized membrane protein
MTVIFLSEKTHVKKVFSAFFKQEFPADLILVLVWLAASIGVIYLPFLNTTTIRIIFALPVILFIPGYCLIAALFPKEDDIELIERIALSFGLSIAVVPLMGFGLNFTPWGVRLDPIVLSLILFTLVMVLCAYYRRSLLPPEERFRMPFSQIAGSLRKELFPGGRSRFDRFLTATLILVILIGLITTISVFTVPKEGERFTEFFVLGENRTAAMYPDRINTSQNYPIYVGIGNHEFRSITYTIETWIIRTEFNNLTNTSRIIAMDPNDKLSLTLAHNETRIIPYNLSVKKTGYNRFEFLLYKEIVPGFEVSGNDRINASYRNLHLWVTVLERQNQENQIDVTG